MKTLSISEAEKSFPSLLLEIEKKGERYVICREGLPIADLIPHLRKDRITPHPVARKIKIKYDPTETLTRDEWPEEE